MWVESIDEDEEGAVRLRLGDEMTWGATKDAFVTIYLTIKAPALLKDISRSVRVSPRARSHCRVVVWSHPHPSHMQTSSASNSQSHLESLQAKISA